MKELEIFYAYDNNELYFLLIKNYQNNPLIIHEESIEKFFIDELNDDKFANKLQGKIREIFAKNKEKYNLKTNDVNLLISPEAYHFKSSEFSKTFEEKSIINEKDLERLKKYALNFEKTEGEKAIDFIIRGQYINGTKHDNIVGLEADEITIFGDFIIIDKKTDLYFKEIFKNLDFKIKNFFILDYYLTSKIVKKNEGILELNNNKMQFSIGTPNGNKSFLVNIGTVSILEKVYEILAEKYTPKEAEEITRFIKKTWVLKKYPYDYDIIENIGINSITPILIDVLYQYFDFIFAEVKKQRIDIEKLYVISEEIEIKELIEFLNNMQLNIEFENFFQKDIVVSSYVNNKMFYGLKKIYGTSKEIS